MRKLRIFVRPLAFPELDEPIASHLQKEVSAESFLAFLCTPGLTSDLPSLVDRYRKVAANDVPLFSAPLEERILDKLVWPLRHAKASYIFGNYIGTIALTGMVAEMVAMLIFELSQPQVNGQPLDPSVQKTLFGSPFERLSQERRVNVLRAYRLATDAQVEAFNSIRAIRRKYLHLWSQDHEAIPNDAAAAFHSAASLVSSVLNQEVKDGVMYLSAALSRYLDRKGAYAPDITEEV